MDNWPETSESLLQRLNDQQDVAAWNEFLAIYRPVVLRMAQRRGLQHADADDLAQQVFMSVARKVNDWEPHNSETRFRNWLGRIARNAILNELVRAKPDRAAGAGGHDLVLGQVPDQGELSIALTIEARRQALLWAASAVEGEFSSSTWEMFYQTAIDGRPVNEVADGLGRSAGAVYIARCRVMQRIKEKVQELSDFWSQE
ncbi:MAG: sigma-70 family RNA polymerase sigma factor [Pirellula sp.]